MHDRLSKISTFVNDRLSHATTVRKLKSELASQQSFFQLLIFLPQHLHQRTNQDASIYQRSYAGEAQPAGGHPHIKEAEGDCHILGSRSAGLRFDFRSTHRRSSPCLSTGVSALMLAQIKWLTLS